MTIPFWPNVESLKEWLETIPAGKRVELCTFLVTTEARSVFAAQIDAAFATLVKEPGQTYETVGAMFDCSKSNVQRRVTRHRARTGTRKPPRRRRAAAE